MQGHRNQDIRIAPYLGIIPEAFVKESGQGRAQNGIFFIFEKQNEILENAGVNAGRTMNPAWRRIGQAGKAERPGFRGIEKTSAAPALGARPWTKPGQAFRADNFFPGALQKAGTSFTYGREDKKAGGPQKRGRDL